MTRRESTARCVLVSMSDELELRVVMDGAILWAERCERYEQAFALAERCRARLTERGWMRLLPAPPPTSVRRRTST